MSEERNFRLLVGGERKQGGPPNFLELREADRQLVRDAKTITEQTLHANRAKLEELTAGMAQPKKDMLDKHIRDIEVAAKTMAWGLLTEDTEPFDGDSFLANKAIQIRQQNLFEDEDTVKQVVALAWDIGDRATDLEALDGPVGLDLAREICMTTTEVAQCSVDSSYRAFDQTLQNLPDWLQEQIGRSLTTAMSDYFRELEEAGPHTKADPAQLAERFRETTQRLRDRYKTQLPDEIFEPLLEAATAHGRAVANRYNADIAVRKQLPHLPPDDHESGRWTR